MRQRERQGHKGFKYEASWGLAEECGEIVERGWKSCDNSEEPSNRVKKLMSNWKASLIHWWNNIAATRDKEIEIKWFGCKFCKVMKIGVTVRRLLRCRKS